MMSRFTVAIVTITLFFLTGIPTSFANFQDISVYHQSDEHGAKKISASYIMMDEHIQGEQNSNIMNGKGIPNTFVIHGGDGAGKSPYNVVDRAIMHSRTIIERSNDEHVNVFSAWGNHEGDFNLKHVIKNLKFMVNGVKANKLAQGNKDYEKFKMIVSNLELRDDMKHLEEYIGKHMDYTLYAEDGVTPKGKMRIFNIMFADFHTKAPGMNKLFGPQTDSTDKAIRKCHASVDLYNRTAKDSDKIRMVMFANHMGNAEAMKHRVPFYSSLNEGREYRTMPIGAAHSHQTVNKPVKAFVDANPMARIIESGAHYDSFAHYVVNSQGNFVRDVEFIPVNISYEYIDKQLKEGRYKYKRYAKLIEDIHQSVDKSMKFLKLDHEYGIAVGTSNDGKMYAKLGQQPQGRATSLANARGGKEKFKLWDSQNAFEEKIIDYVGLQNSSGMRNDKDFLGLTFKDGSPISVMRREHVINSMPFGDQGTRTFLIRPQTLEKLINEINNYRFVKSDQTYGTQLSPNIIQSSYSKYHYVNPETKVITPLNQLDPSKYFVVTLDPFYSLIDKSPSKEYPHLLPILSSLIFDSEKVHFIEVPATHGFKDTQFDIMDKYFFDAYNEVHAPLVRNGVVDVTSPAIQNHILYKKYSPSLENIKAIQNLYNIKNPNRLIQNCNKKFRRFREATLYKKP